jgi:integrase/recombinase XerD
VPVSISPASAGGTVRPHQTQLPPFAVPEVLAWLRERRAIRIPGELLFPATLDGGRLNKATVYRQVKATFARAGIKPSHQGGRTLRNSFAARELKAGGRSSWSANLWATDGGALLNTTSRPIKSKRR